MIVDLPLIWAMLIAIAILMYVVLDGFDLGIGILFPAIKGERNRDLMIKTIAPVWDGNETWLVFGGGGLFAVFPLAYSVLLTAFYAPLIAMLLALVFRGVAFEFRFKDPKHKPFWDLAFVGGSTAAAFSQGVVLGAFIQGIEIEGRSYAGGWYDWLTPFSLFTGLALVVGYGLLGAGWLVIKTTGALQQRVYVIMRPLVLATLAAIAAVSLWTPFLNGEIAERWFSWPNIVYLSPVPLLVAAGAVGLYRAIQLKRQFQPFVLTLGLFLLSYLGLGISLYPYIIPPEVTLWAAAAPDESLAFLLVGTVVLLPLIFAYTGYSYWVFRGKVKLDDGYD